MSRCALTRGHLPSNARRGALFAARSGVCGRVRGLVDERPCDEPSLRPSTTTASVGIRLDDLDASVPPCEDFYRHANGRWLATAAIPPDEPSWGAFAEVREGTLAVLREILEEAARSGAAQGSIAQKVGDFYASGMDEVAIERAGLDPLRELLAAVQGLADRAEIADLLALCHSRSVPAGFAFFIRPDPKESRTYLVHLQQAGLGLPDRDYYLRDDTRSAELRDAYRVHVSHLFELVGDPPAAAAAQAETVLAIEHALAQASMPRAEQRDPYRVYNKRSPRQLAAEASGLDWARYLRALAAPALDELNVRQPEFFQEVAALGAALPLSAWRTYLRWHVLHAAAPYLHAPFELEHFAFYGRTLTGVVEQRPRWKRVLDALNAALGEALGQLYVERVFPPEAKARVLELVEDLRAALRERILTLAWMSQGTKAQALRKLDAIRVKMAYPDRWRDYGALEVDRGPYLGNVLHAAQFETRRNLGKLGRPVDRDEWLMPPQTVNAYYNASLNEIVFPAAILQRPFFAAHADDASNYGAIGAVIGHEMSHGFDDAGSQYDAEGNLVDWWEAEDRKAYAERGELIVGQFDGYEPLPGARVNGRLCLGENIGDLGGVKVALAAFRRALGRQSGPAEREGLSPFQRFFLAFAQSFRALLRDELLRVRLTVDPHAPPQFRVNGPLSNLPEFHAAFGCGPLSPMRRSEEERPSIW